MSEALSNYRHSSGRALPAWAAAYAGSNSSQSPRSTFEGAGPKPQKTPEKVTNPVILLTVRNVADYFQVSEKTIRRMIAAGALPVVRIGRSIRIELEVIEKMTRQNE